MRISDAKLAELEALDKAATPGPWVDRGESFGDIRTADERGNYDGMDRIVLRARDRDRPLIAALRNSASDLLADIREAKKTIAFLRKLREDAIRDCPEDD